MTLIFNLATWFMFATHRLIMIILSAKLLSNPSMHNKGMSRTRTGFTDLCTKFNADYDLDLRPSAWFLLATHLSVMMIICAELLENPTMHNKVMGRTQPGFTEICTQRLSADCGLYL